MLQKKWFKIFIWFLATAFFLIASSIIIPIFNPTPDEKSVMNFMSGMMSAMDSSTMGYTMQIEEDSFLKNIIYLSEKITIPIIAIGALCGAIVLIRRKMINKKKINFYQLTFISIAFIITILLFNWGFHTTNNRAESMMSQSMGQMMSSMHLKNATISNLLKYEREDKSNISATSNHHENNNFILKGIHYITTVVIILLLPFIIAGTIYLAILWLY